MKKPREIWTSSLYIETIVENFHNKVYIATETLGTPTTTIKGDRVFWIEKFEYQKIESALDRVMKEVELSTDKLFYEHCKQKIEEIRDIPFQAIIYGKENFKKNFVTFAKKNLRFLEDEHIEELEKKFLEEFF